MLFLLFLAIMHQIVFTLCVKQVHANTLLTHVIIEMFDISRSRMLRKKKDSAKVNGTHKRLLVKVAQLHFLGVILIKFEN